MKEVISWLIDSDEPWTRFRVLTYLLARPAPDPSTSFRAASAVVSAQADLVAHPKVRALIASALTWGDEPLKWHNDSAHPLYAISTLADFGLCASDPGIHRVVEKILAHQSPEGAFQTKVNVAAAFGGTGKDQWTWMGY